MANNFTWKGNKVACQPVSKPKKITGTRFASILGYNSFNSPFQTWCEITKTWVKPFEDTIYTIAGKTIEPKQADYIKDVYFYEDLKSPTDIYGKDYFKKTWGDFFPENRIFGGMWDYLFYKDGKAKTVLEMKTTKRAEDWVDDVPIYYGLQASLYATLLGVDDVMMVCTILSDEDYDDPESFEVTRENTFVRRFSVKEKYPYLPQMIDTATSWWEKHVIGCISPEFDEKVDKEYLDGLRKNVIPPTEIQVLMERAEELSNEIEKVESTIKDQKNELKTIQEAIKNKMMENFRDGDKKVSVEYGTTEWTLSLSYRQGFDKKSMEKDGVFEKYKTQTAVYKLTNKKKGE